jgi:hypothetical protein
MAPRLRFGTRREDFSPERYCFREICAIIRLTRGFGFKNRNFGGFSLGQEVPKTNF